MATASETIQIYNSILFRDPTDAEIASFVAASQTAEGQTQQIDLLVNSSEAMTNVYPVVRLFEATFGRVPDQAGINFWVDYYRDAVASGTSSFEALSVINAGFAASSEFAAKYPDAAASGTVDEAFLDALYMNVLGRAADDEGKAFYLGKSIDSVLTAFAQSSETIDKFDPYVDLFLTKAANGNQDYTGDLLDANDDGTVDDADVAVVTPGQVGQTLTLTEAIDNLVGTGKDDTFIAGSTGGKNGGTTLTAGDVIDGGEGTDRLNIFTNANAANFGAATISSVEQVYAQFDTTGGTLDVSANADVKQAWVANGSTGDSKVTLTKAQTAGLEGKIGDGATFVFSDSTNVAGDSANLALNGATAGKNGVTIANIETLNVAATGTNSIGTLTADQLTTLNVTGEGSLSATVVDGTPSLTTVDASGNSGGVSLNLEAAGNGKDITVTGSSANDEITLKTADLTKADTIDLGAGDMDTLAFTTTDLTLTNATQAAVLSKVSNVEVLKGVGVDLNVDGDFISQNMFALQGDGTDVKATNLDNGATVTFLAGDHTATGSNIGLKLGSSTLNLALTGTTADESQVKLTATGTSAINIATTDFAETKGGNELALTAADNQKIVLTGSGDFIGTFNAATGTTGFNIDGSAVTGKLDLTGTKAADIIVGGDSADTLRGEGSADVPATAQKSTIDYVASFDQGDVITIKFDGTDYTYTLPGAQGADVDSDNIFDKLSNFSDGKNTLADALTNKGVTSSYDTTSDTITLTGKADGTSFTVESSVDNSKDTFDKAAFQTVDPAGTITLEDGKDIFSLSAGGTSYDIKVATDTSDASKWDYTNAGGSYDDFLKAVAGGTSADGASVTVTGDTITITAPAYLSSLANPVQSATFSDNGTPVAASLANTAADGAPSDQANPTVTTTVTGVAAGTAIDVVANKADTFTGNGGADKFFIATASGDVAADADVITDFTTGSDTLNFDFNGTAKVDAAAGTLANYAEGTAAVVDFAAAVAAATAQVDGTVIYSAQQVGSDTYVFYDGNSDGDLSDTGTDYLVKLSGVGLDGIAYTDIA
ncbi:MAG: DUF4214 domain-containing protein [Fulvimarina manganoxydans]|uniref:DUF4214 domain-containing protein n=1 Tax=Fulvimarina manganoxydans TaxID=937218 RepID=UPI002357D2C8|nr:DUF4214 domain-containing protein [Fulvimarina manganoxydans]MCK5934514.1 DUF4214 domain-containing protein [Fulvimarina manganoxydans]